MEKITIEGLTGKELIILINTLKNDRDNELSNGTTVNYLERVNILIDKLEVSLSKIKGEK